MRLFAVVAAYFSFADFVYCDRNGTRKLSTLNRRLLVVRVVAPDASTTASVDELSDSVFGLRGDKYNLRNQYRACSFNQLVFDPVVNASYGVFGGVKEVRISQKIKNATSSVVEKAVTKAIGGGKPSFADNVMYCLPPGTLGSWLAYGYTNSWLSVYNDKWCEYLSAQMHEMGHNLNLGHANQNGIRYGDKSGYMGYSFGQDDTPLMCFDAYHSWQLGWYSKKSILLKEGQAFRGYLSGIVDYVSGNSTAVLIRLETNTSMSYYISYNKKTGFNSGTKDGINQVLIVTAEGNGKTYSNSNLVSKLGSGGSFTFPNGKNILRVFSVDPYGKAGIYIGPITQKELA